MGIQEPITLLRRFFSGLAEHTFQVRLGVVDPPMIEYVGTLLLRFIRADQPRLPSPPMGRPRLDLDRLLMAAEPRGGAARRELHRQIGDFALYWTGLFPESLRRRHAPSDLDWYHSYCLLGKRAYLIASEIEAPDDAAPGALLERLGQHFEMCAYGLREIRRAWETPEPGSGPSAFLIS